MNLGATIVSWKLGQFADKKELVLGFEDGASYLSPDNPYFGLLLGESTHFQAQQSAELQIELRRRD
jgi:galactose mutarotase-like enzyme